MDVTQSWELEDRIRRARQLAQDENGEFRDDVAHFLSQDQRVDEPGPYS